MGTLPLTALLLLSLHASATVILPKRRLSFVASTNAGSSSLQPLADLLISRRSSWNVAHAYCSSPGEITNASVLPEPPFCYNNWTLPIRAAAPHVLHIPIIQMLGNAGPLNFAHPYVFAEKYVGWAERWNFDGFLLDAEFKGDDAAFSAFLSVFADALHAANKSLGVFLYPDLGKKDLVNRSTADYWLGTWGGKCSTIPGFIWACNPYYGRGGMMLYQRDAACTGGGIAEMFSTWKEARMEETGFWANAADMGDSWYDAMAAFLNATGDDGDGGEPGAAEAPAPPPPPPPEAAVALPAGSPLPPWNYSGFSRFPSFYFGASTGSQSPSQLALVARFSLAGWGWQQGFGGGHGEAQGLAAARALRRVAPVGLPNSPDAAFVYRQSEALFTYYDTMKNLTTDPALAPVLYAAQLRDPVTGRACGGGGLLSFSNATFVGYWTDVVGGELAREAPSVAAVFLDGFDKLYAGDTLAAQGCPAFGANATAAALRAKVAATAAQAVALRAGGVVPIISTYNYLKGAAATAPPLGAMNGVYEDELVAGLAGTPWLRFYEVWLGHGAEQDAIQISNAILEGAAGVPFVARSDPRNMHTLEYGAAGFLVAQGSHCYWGASTGWLDPDWPWRGIFDWRVGTPLGPAQRSGRFAWTRRFTAANVSVNTEKGWAELAFADGRVVRGSRDVQ
jgi:hypothetical protein